MVGPSLEGPDPYGRSGLARPGGAWERGDWFPVKTLIVHVNISS